MTTKKLHLFIDTNAFLSFFAYTKDDVEQLEKLVNLIRTEQVALYLTAQVRDEFYRNREKKLHESIAQFEKNTGLSGVPRFMADYPQIGDFRKAEQDLLKAKNEAIQRAKKEAGTGMLAADRLFRELANVAQVKDITQDDYVAAVWRMRRGNPPGKEGSLGDRLNWEILLRTVKDESDLHIISKDGDFLSPLNPTHPNGFLVSEWGKRKNARLFVHPELKPFLAQEFPKVQFAVDVEKRVAIDRLKNSGGFAITHSAIAQLLPFTDALTTDEISELLEAAKTNGQVGLIATDEDIAQFYEPLLELQHDNRRFSDEEYREWRRYFGLDSTLGDNSRNDNHS